MEIRELQGLSVAFVDVAEALDADWDGLRGKVDIARVTMPPRKRWAQLEAAGFFAKPARLSWVARVRETEEEFLVGMSDKDRNNIRIARRRTAASGLRLAIERPLRRALLEEFLPLYQVQVASMRHGVAIAEDECVTMLAEADRYFAVTARAGEELAGICIAQVCPEQDLVKVRFAAVDLTRRDSSLSRVLYLDALGAAREMGYDRAGLGTDPNLYGHIVKAGLFSFKWRLGFTAVPSQSVIAGDGFDEADRVLRFRALTQPVLLTSYVGSAGVSVTSPQLRGEMYTADQLLDVRPYQASFLAEVRTHQLR